MKAVLVSLLLIALLAAPAHALTYSRYRTMDRPPLPLINVYDPETHDNQRITKYSYEELDAMFDSPGFRRWNDLDKVCQSMEIMFGRAGTQCAGVTPMDIPARSARAYVDFSIVPPPQIVYEPRIIVVTDPLTPPWPPTYQRYRSDEPYPLYPHPLW